MLIAVVGATGAVGSDVIRQVCYKQPQDVRLVLYVRRSLEPTFWFNKSSENELAVKWFESNATIEVVDFDKLEETSPNIMEGCSSLISCLGTTRAKMGLEGLKKVDRDYVINTAQIAREKGVETMILCSSGAVNQNSWFPYLRYKGEAIESLKKMNFPKLYVYKPGVLLCDRQESRPMERGLQIICSALDRASWFSISTKDIAKSMLWRTMKYTPSKEPPIYEDVNHPEITSEAKSWTTEA